MCKKNRAQRESSGSRFVLLLKKKGISLHMSFFCCTFARKLRADNKRDKKKPPRVLIHKRPGTSSRQTGGVASAEKGKNMTYNRNKHIGNKYYAAIYNII